MGVRFPATGIESLSCYDLSYLNSSNCEQLRCQHAQHLKALSLKLFRWAKFRELNLYLGFHFPYPGSCFNNLVLQGFEGGINQLSVFKKFLLHGMH